MSLRSAKMQMFCKKACRMYAREHFCTKHFAGLQNKTKTDEHFFSTWGEKKFVYTCKNLQKFAKKILKKNFTPVLRTGVKSTPG